MTLDMWPTLSLTVLIIVVGAIMLMIISRRQAATSLDRAWYTERWHGITEQVGDGPAGRQLAIINADKLLDKAMREKGFKGDNMGQRLKNNPSAFSGLNDVWFAHKLRNRIAHESDTDITEGETRRALAYIERGLRDLGAL